MGEEKDHRVKDESEARQRRRSMNRDALEQLNQISEVILREHHGQPFEDSVPLI